MPAVRTRTSGADRIAPIHCSMKTTSSGAMNGDEQRWGRIGLAGSRPTRAELVARGACASREPLVVDHRAREHDAVRVGVVHADRFGLLRLVPDVDFVGLCSNQSFVRQVVPAEDGKRGSDTEPLRRDVVNRSDPMSTSGVTRITSGRSRSTRLKTARSIGIARSTTSSAFVRNLFPARLWRSGAPRTNASVVKSCRARVP